MISFNLYRQLYQKIINSKNIFLCSHKNCPDATASLIAFIKICQKQKKPFYAFLENEVLSSLKNLSGAAEIRNLPPNLAVFDLWLIADCSDLRHTGLSEQLRAARNIKQNYLVNLDHHASNNFFADLNLVDANASSACELVYNFYQANHLNISPAIARGLLTGILSDTDHFLNAGTSGDSLAVAAELFKQGIDITCIAKLFKKNNLAKIKLAGKIFSRLKINSRYNIAFTYLRQKDLNGLALETEALDALANGLNQVGGVKAVFLAKEQADGSYKISIRSTYPGVDVSHLAKMAGGGGHQKAAGFTARLNDKF